LIQEFRGAGEQLFPPATHLPAQRLRSKQNIQTALRGGGTALQSLELFQILGTDQSRFGFAARFQYDTCLAVGDLVDEDGESVFA
jgi:hypothetical protein